MLCHKRKQGCAARSPKAEATPCRLWRQKAIQTQHACAFLSTNDHRSSRSSTVDAAFSGLRATKVVLKGGSWATFFYSNWRPLCERHQTYASGHANCCVLDTRATSPRDEP